MNINELDLITVTVDLYMWYSYSIHAGKGPIIMMNQLKSIYNSPFKSSHSPTIHTSLATIASNEKNLNQLELFIHFSFIIFASHNLVKSSKT